MSNWLKMADVKKIKALLALKWPRRRIARELHVSRTTVAAYAAALTSKQAISIPGSGGAAGDPPAIAESGASQADALGPKGVHETVAPSSLASPPPAPSNCAISILGSVGRKSQCAGFEDLILEKLESGLSGQRIFQDLGSEVGFTGSYSSVRRFVRKAEAATPVPFRRMERAPGEEAQVDFGEGALTSRPGKETRRRPPLLRVILSHSRKGYTEVVWHQTTDDLIRCMENAFASFGGVPKTVVIDNLKAAVLEADWFDPTITPKFQSFANHYGFVVLPSKPYTPRHKGKVESGVNYAQENAVKGRTFASLEEQNRFLLEWERTVADLRIHGTTRRQVRMVFEAHERKALQPLPAERFPLYQEGQRTVHTDGHVTVSKAYYSAPPEFTGREVWVQWDGRLVRIFDQKQRQIAIHAAAVAGTFSTHPEHVPNQKISATERGTQWYLDKAHRVGPKCGRWADELIALRGLHGIRVLQGFVGLAAKNGWKEMEHAAETATKHGSFRLRVIRKLLKSGSCGIEQLEFIESHPLIRDPLEYGLVVRDAFEGTVVR